MRVAVKCEGALQVALAGSLMFTSPSPARAQPSPGGEDVETRFMLAGGLLVPTVIAADGELVAAAPGPLLLISFERPLTADGGLDWGGFLDVGGFSAGDSDEQVNLMQLGASLHWRFPDTWNGLVRVGGRLGYRQLFADARVFDAVRGVALDFSAQYLKTLSMDVTGQIEVGLLGQPVGGNANGLVYFGPFPYLSLGVVF